MPIRFNFLLKLSFNTELDGAPMENRDKGKIPSNLIMLVEDNDETFFGFWDGEKWFVLINQPDMQNGELLFVLGTHQIINWCLLPNTATNNDMTAIPNLIPVILNVSGYAHPTRPGFIMNGDVFEIRFNFTNFTTRNIPINSSKVIAWDIINIT